MRMPLFLCIRYLDHHLYSTSHWGHHYVSPFVYVLIISHILILDPHYLFFWHCYEHGYACLVHIHVTHYMYLIHFLEPIIEYQKTLYFEWVSSTYLWVSLVSPLLSPLFPWSYDVHRPYDEILPSHIKGQYVNTKKCSPISPWSKPYTYIIFPPYFPYFWPSQLHFHKKWSKTSLFTMVYPHSLPKTLKRERARKPQKNTMGHHLG